VPLGGFVEIVEGCEADVRGVAYSTFDDLLHYCRCVAGSVGRLSLGVFGTVRGDVAESRQLADTLGLALQVTNILRDVLEDRGNGRVYLPKEDLDRFGVTLELDGDALADDPARLAELVRFEAGRAEERYATGLRLLGRLDRRSAACVAAMAGIYHRLLRRIEADPTAVMRARVRLSGGEKARVALRALALGRA
ncbi:MAG: squalene/phytoene synthase family protein, partial [Streptosporangiales bacterium]|nr:squalene/phytoene synthase family protein [Streptosporangiales bacterium]